MNAEAWESKHIKMKPSIVRKAYPKAIEQDKTLGRWIKDTIEQKLVRKKTEEKHG